MFRTFMKTAMYLFVSFSNQMIDNYRKAEKLRLLGMKFQWADARVKVY